MKAKVLIEADSDPVILGTLDIAGKGFKIKSRKFTTAQVSKDLGDSGFAVSHHKLGMDGTYNWRFRGGLVFWWFYPDLASGSRQRSFKEAVNTHLMDKYGLRVVRHENAASHNLRLQRYVHGKSDPAWQAWQKSATSEALR